MRYNLLNRFSGNVQMSVNIECSKDASESKKKGLAVMAALRVKASLENANLENAYLKNADLENAYLRGTNLRGANLKNANLENADLEGVSLECTKLIFANLRSANLRGAALNCANLNCASLENADLENAYLRGTNLEGANLKNATYGKGIFMEKKLVFVSGLTHTMLNCSGNVLILDTHMEIGCHLHSFSDWWAFSDDEIATMDADAGAYWMSYKKVLKAIAKAAGRDV
jgi:hypothetical protein